MRSRTNSKAAVCAAMGWARRRASGSIGLRRCQSGSRCRSRSEAPVLPTYPIQLALRHVCDPCAIPYGETAQVQVTAHHIARVLDFPVYSAAAAGPLKVTTPSAYAARGRSPLRRGVTGRHRGGDGRPCRSGAGVRWRAGELMREWPQAARFERLLARLPPLTSSVGCVHSGGTGDGVSSPCRHGVGGFKTRPMPDGRRVDPLVAEYRERASPFWMPKKSMLHW